MNDIFYNGNPNGNPKYYTLGNNGQYNEVSDPSNTPLGNLGAIGSNLIQQGKVKSLPDGAITIPNGAVVSNTAGSTNNNGVTSTLGGTPQVPGAPTPTDNSAQYGGIISGLQSANAGTVSALQEQENATLAATRQSQAGETAGYAQTAATLQGIGGISTLWTNFFSNLNDAHQNTLNSLKSQYDSAIATANGNLASQIATVQQNAIAANQAQQQQFFQNAMSVFNAQVGLINQQTTTSQAQQQIDLSKQNQAFQQKQATVTQFQNEFNAVIPSLEGQGWSSLSTDQQKQITDMAQNAGIPGSVVQNLIDTKKVAGTVTENGAFGNTVLFYDQSGKTIRSIYQSNGIDPHSTLGQQTIAGFGTTDTTSNTGWKWINTSVTPASDRSAVLSGGIQMGYKPLTAAQSQVMTSITTSLGYIDNVASAVSEDKLLAANTSELASGYMNRTLSEALQMTGGSSDANTQKIHNDLNTLGTLNDEIVGAIKTVASAGGGSVGGMALGSLLRVNEKTGQQVYIDPNQTIQTIMTNLDNLQKALYTQGNQMMGTSITAPGFEGTNSSVTNFLGGIGITGSSGSTSASF